LNLRPWIINLSAQFRIYTHGQAISKGSVRLSYASTPSFDERFSKNAERKSWTRVGQNALKQQNGIAGKIL